MLKKKAVIGSMLFLLCGFYVAQAQNLAMKPYLYSENFDGKDVPLKFKEGDGKYTINFKGFTDEQKCSGNKCYKLDVTIESGSYCWFTIPISVPVEGDLKFSGHCLLDQKTTGSMGMGINFKILPVGTGISDAFEGYFDTTKGEWKLLEGDIVKSGKGGGIPWLMSQPDWPCFATAENVSVSVEGIGVFLMGKKGDRVIVYIDDLKIEGVAPEEAAYLKEVEKRWKPVNEKNVEKISAWEKTLTDREKEFNSLNNLSPEAETVKKKIKKEQIDSFKAKIEALQKTNQISSAAAIEIDEFLDNLKSNIDAIRSISNGNNKGKDCIIYITKSVSERKILPTSGVSGEISNEINVIGTPGEYEPASFTILALTNITALQLNVSQLKKGAHDVIPAESIDVKVVKCWYQGGSAWVGEAQNKNKRVLVPELILKDDTLVKVDYVTEKNYLKVVRSRGTAAAKEQYIWISDPDELPSKPDLRAKDINDYAMMDSPILLPVDIPAGTVKQFWLTIKVPDTAAAGIYSGDIILSSGNRTITTLTVKLKVLPFKLAAPKTRYNLANDIDCSVYYHGRLDPAWPNGSISSEYKSKEQLKAELTDMFIHGVDNPLCNQGADEKLLGEYLKIRQEVGSGGKTLYLLNWNSGRVDANSEPAAVRKVVNFAKAHGIPEVYFYGMDEAMGEKLTGQRPRWESTRQAGGKVFVAGVAEKNYDAMGDIQDLLVCNRVLSREEAAHWHSRGHKIWSYFNPQGGVENPEIYRRNYGLGLWNADYDGACTFSYHAAAGNPWNDFDDNIQRDFMFTYPTINGVIDTIAWEGYREGIDDIRYVTTLKLAIEKAKQSDDKSLRDDALAAEQWLSKLDTTGDLDAIRLEIINHILKLKKEKTNWFLRIFGGVFHGRQ